MRKLVVIEFITLDRVMQGPGSLDEDREGGLPAEAALLIDCEGRVTR